MRYHPYENIDPFKIPETADKLLNEYWDIAKSLGIKTFLWHGTCLGFIRGDGYIANDNDIDVGILNGLEELTLALVKADFIDKGIQKRSRHFLRYGILLDINFNFSDKEFLQSFSKIVYKGRSFNVPHPVEEYLKARYGDWRAEKFRKLWKGEK